MFVVDKTCVCSLRAGKGGKERFGGDVRGGKEGRFVSDDAVLAVLFNAGGPCRKSTRTDSRAAGPRLTRVD